MACCEQLCVEETSRPFENKPKALFALVFVHIWGAVSFLCSCSDVSLQYNRYIYFADTWPSAAAVGKCRRHERIFLILIHLNINKHIYNAGKTLSDTYQEIPFDIVDDVILVDDNSNDNTKEIAKELGINHIIIHKKNLGYGGNQKSCYNKALEIGGDIIIMLHPDYQYTPKLIHSMSYLIANEV